MKRLLSLIGVPVLVLAVVACGGDSKGGGLLGGAGGNQPDTSSGGNSSSSSSSNNPTPATANSSNGGSTAKSTPAPSSGGNSVAASSDVTKFANQYVMTFFNVTFGFTDPQQLLNMFDTSCTSKVNAKSITAALAVLKGMLPKVDKLDDVDLGKLNVEKISGGYKVTPADPNAARIKIKGQFVKASDYFAKLGFGDEANDISNDPLTLKETNGKLTVADCSDLLDLTSP